MGNYITRRIDLHLGYTCNQACRFCYYQNALNKTKYELSKNRAKKLLRYYKKINMEIVEFTGGEPTLREDIIELANYAKSLGFKSLSMISNGILLENNSFSEELIKAGIDDYLITILGPNSDVHDYLTKINGSFEKAINSIRILKRKGMRVRTNTIITKVNHNKLDGLFKILLDEDIDVANLILFNPIIEAKDTDTQLWVKYTDVVPEIKNIINKYGNRLKKLRIRYIPFCLMLGYEKYITNMPQIQYDQDEWNYLVRTRVKYGILIKYLAMVIGIIFLSKQRRYPNTSWNITKHEGIKKFLELKNKVKGPQCRTCSHKIICDGLWKEYAKYYGFNELKTIRGNIIDNPKIYFN